MRSPGAGTSTTPTASTPGSVTRSTNCAGGRLTGEFPFSPAYFLKAVIKQLPLATVDAVAINGHLDCPDGPDEIADYALYGVEGTAHGIRQRIYLLDTGTAGVPLAVDHDVREPALTPPPVDLTTPDPA